MSETVKIPDNVPVSWLQRLRELGPDVLMLASEPNDDTETQYMSKYFTYAMLMGRMSADLSIGRIVSQVSDLYDGKASLSSYLTGQMRLDVSDPYIISSMTHIVSSDGRFGVVSCDGYRLSTGMLKVLSNLVEAGGELSVVIPQLSARTTYVENPSANFISSITDANGHVQSFGYGRFGEALSANIPTATKSVGDGYAISSVTTKAGVVTSVGGVSIRDVVGPTSQVFYADYTGEESAADRFDRIDLYVMKLKKAQLAELSASGGIRKDCIYLTTDDSIFDAEARASDDGNIYIVAEKGAAEQ